MADAIRGTVNGTVAVAVAEGAVIGAAYILLVCHTRSCSRC